MSLAKFAVLLNLSICGVQAIRRPEQDESCLLEAEFDDDFARQISHRFGNANSTPSTPAFGGVREPPILGNSSASPEYSLNEEVEYLSTTYCQWMEAFVTQPSDASGFCTVSCKPGQLVPVQNIRKPSAGTTYEQGEAVYYLSQSAGCIHVPATISSVSAETVQAVYRLEFGVDRQIRDRVPLNKLAKDPRVSYSTDQEVFCFSGTLAAWVPARVQDVDGDGAVNVQYVNGGKHKEIPKEWVTTLLQPSRFGGIDPCLQDAVEFDCYRKGADKKRAEVWKRSSPGDLGGGSFGSVSAVTTGTGRDGAVKRARDSADYLLKREASVAILKEVDAMKNLKSRLEAISWWSQCEQYFTLLLDSKPCMLVHHPYNDSGEEVVAPSFSSFVINRMTTDLHTWMHERLMPKTPFHECMKWIIENVRNALVCMHQAGFAHMDVKEANVFLQIPDDTRCPEEVRLGDFGETEIIGSEMDYRSEEDRASAWYMPEEMFEDSGAGRTGKFSVHPKYDWCMFLSMFFQWPEHALPQTTATKYDYGWEGDCGKMGFNRRNDIRLQSSEDLARESKEKNARAAADRGMQPRHDPRNAH